MEIEIYTDGACSGNPGKGGWAYIILDKTSGTEIFQDKGGEKKTTNNRMELLAVINALKKLEKKRVQNNMTLKSVSVCTDSQYVQLGISSWIINWKKNNWKTASKQPVKNQDLCVELDKLNTEFSPQWFWIKGHAGNKYNEQCDKLAVQAALEI